MQAYREAEEKAAKSKTLHDLPPGQRLMLTLAKPLIDRIAVMQDELNEAMGKRGQPPLYQVQLQLLQPEKLAIITISSVLRAVLDVEITTTAASVRAISLSLSDAIRCEVEFERWTAEAEAGDKKLLQRMERRYPDMTKAQWKKWRAKVDAVVEEPWSLPTKISLGAALVSALSSSSDGLIKVETLGVQEGGETRVVADERVKELLEDRRARAECARPKLLPMLMPPKPWRAI